ncbi:ribonuclease HII [uncultured Akkermansia sp.]|uniref:ribonuclease HII n=1 Tax=uncultured Akkermansia sp. TaxID=512294 RepID=UPI002603074C|nr:ribonuclease HII [uncultured Akkermansia sp.]
MKEKTHPDMSFEMEARASGFLCVAGVDEAGRGPLAGPVVAGAVILLVLAEDLAGLNDSKQLTAAKRERLFLALLECEQAVCSVGVASVEEIDRFNILRATHLAMARAVEGLALRADFCLVDGLPVKGLPVPHRAIVKGDGRSLSIAAASVLAKVTRDRMMTEADASYPQYGFAKHKGYGTKAHMEALRRHGPCPLHRRSFAPVSQMELSFPEQG